MNRHWFWLLFGITPNVQAHVGHHDPGLLATVVHAAAGLAPWAPLLSVLLLFWARSRSL